MPCLAIPVLRYIEANTLEYSAPAPNRKAKVTRGFSKKNSVLRVQRWTRQLAFQPQQGLHTQALADGRDRARLVEGIEMQTRRAALQKTIA